MHDVDGAQSRFLIRTWTSKKALLSTTGGVEVEEGIESEMTTSSARRTSSIGSVSR